MRISNVLWKWLTPGKLLYLLVVLGLLLLSTPAVASNSGPYELSWWSVDGGGGASSGGDYVLGGTIGQADSSQVLGSEMYALTGGFWAGVGAGKWTIYLPLVLR